MKTTIFIITLLICSICSSQEEKIDSLFIEFKKASFYSNVYPAKLRLENLQKLVIPKLIVLVQDTTFVKLTGTADLIYPGAEKFYGHGHYIPYSMDWISIRAGWLLEELTFQDFGYKSSFSEWENKIKGEELKKIRKLQTEKVEKWWKENSKTWNRLESLKEALISDNVNRISEAVQFLRFGETKCDGLNKEVFLKQIKPLALKLERSEDDNIKELGELLKNENLDYWLENTTLLNKNGR